MDYEQEQQRLLRLWEEVDSDEAPIDEDSDQDEDVVEYRSESSDTVQEDDSSDDDRSPVRTPAKIPILATKCCRWMTQCIANTPECPLAPFVSASTAQAIPFVFLPLKGQIIHPSKEIFFDGIQMPVCAISGAKFLTENGWIDLRNPIDTDVPFRLFRDEGRTFLQWVGDPNLRVKMFGRLVMVYLMCREVATLDNKNDNVETIFSPCVAFRIVGTPIKYVNNVSEVAFVADAHSSSNSSNNSQLSVTEYVAIGICSILLGLIYVASVFLYLHLRKRSKRDEDIKISPDDRSLREAEEGIVKNNPLLAIPSHFIQDDLTFSDSNSSDADVAPDIIKHHEDRKKQITAMVHQQKQYSLNIRRSPFSHMETAHQDSTTNERLPEENVSIVETLEGREERPDNLRVLTGSTRKKLYFNPAYFEPQLLLAPPPAALEFLTKIREVIAMAKQKMAAKRYTPNLLNIPEEDNQYAVDTAYDFRKLTSRRNSNISLKRENSRRKTCTGCPGCEPQDMNSLTGKLPEFPVLPACHNCAVNSNENKQRIIRKWLEDVPILRTTSDSQPSQELDSNSIRSPKRLRSPSRSLPAEPRSRALSPRPLSEKGAKEMNYYRRKYSPKQRRRIIRKPNHPPPPPLHQKLEQPENLYDSVPAEEKREVIMNFPPPDMIQQAMEVDRSEEQVATLTKKQMNAVINEFTVHRSLIIPQVESPVLPKKNDNNVDYETDSLERAANKGYSTPSDYADVPSNQSSPTLSTALPDQEEMTMRNAVFNKRTGNMTISKINMDALQEDEHDYELIVMKKGSLNTHTYSLPELLQRNHGYSLVSEVYVNSGYNYGSTPSTPGGSNYSTLERKTLTVRYEEGVEKPGKLLIEVEDCPDNYIPVHESDSFEPDTLDRKPGKQRFANGKTHSHGFADSLERPQQILLRTTGSFRSDAAPPQNEDIESSNFNRVFGSLREIYEAKTKGLRKTNGENDNFTIMDDEKGRILTLEERHARRQRAKNSLVQPDLIPPPPHTDSSIYEHPKPPRRVVNGTNSTKPPLPLKNLKGRSVGNHWNSPSKYPSKSPAGTPGKHSDEDYELCLLQKSRKDGNITNLIQTEDVILKKGSNDQFILRSIIYPCSGDKKIQKHTWQTTLKPEDSGYLSSDSNESKAMKNRDTVSLNGICSETDESLGDGHSESGAESVETHSVFFNRFYRNTLNCGGYGSMDSGVMGEDGQISSDSENISYTTVVPVTTN